MSRAVSHSPYAHVARVRGHASGSVVAQRFPPTTATVQQIDEGSCLPVTDGNDLEMVALRLARLPWPFEVLEPPDLRTAMRDLASRLTAASRD